MQKLKKFLAVFLAAIACFSFAACGKGNGGNSSGSSSSGDDQAKPTSGIISAVDKNVKITIASDMTRESASVQELRFFFNEAMSFMPEVVEDTVTVSKDCYYIALGVKNKMLIDNAEKMGYKVLTKEQIGLSGIGLKTFDNVTCVYGLTEDANCNAVYKFLERTFDYEFFYTDCYNIDRCVKTAWVKFDLKHKPLIDMPCLEYMPLFDDARLIRRMRIKNYYQTWVGGLHSHTHFDLLPKADYQEKYPEWYSSSGTHLCLTAGGKTQDAMIDTMVNNVCNYIANDAEGRNYFSIAQEDSFSICGCDACKTYVAQYENTRIGASMLNLDFTNKVVKEVNAWIAENCPERDITFVTFAYNATKYPPVTFNSSTGEYEPLIQIEDNLNVQFVINQVDYSVPYTEDSNQVSMMAGWHAITDNLSVWQYSTNFDMYLEPFENWGSMSANYQWLAQNGVNYVVEQATHNAYASNFEEMRIYVMSNLCWGETDDTEYLVNKFLKGYYGEGAQSMRDIYDLTRSNIAIIISKGNSIRSNNQAIMEKQHWSQIFLTRLNWKIDEGIAAVEKYKTSDYDHYAQMVGRFEKQRIWIEYWLLLHYGSTYPDIDERWADLNERMETLRIKISETAAGYGGTPD